MTKICSKCKVEKPAIAFCVDQRQADGRNRRCKACLKSFYLANSERIQNSARKTYLKNRERRLQECKAYRDALPAEERIKRHRVQRLKNYGMTQESFHLLSKLQRDCCAICRDKTKLQVDHCHATKKVRGLLCFECNTALGKFKDNPAILKTAIEYLQTGGILE